MVIDVVVPTIPHHNSGKRRISDRARVADTARNATREEMAWLAGIFEGEGSIILENRSGPREYATPRLQVNMVDRDVIEHLQAIAGGRVNRQKAQTPDRQDQWRWTLQGFLPVSYVLDRIWPWLHSRRRTRCEEVMAKCKAVRASIS